MNTEHDLMENYKDPKFLNYWYWDREYSTYDIANMCGASSSTIWDWMKRLCVPTRSCPGGLRTERTGRKISDSERGEKNSMYGRTGTLNPAYRHGGICGGKREKLYRIWQGMKERCYGTRRSKNYKYYGAKNIQVCDEWFNDYTVFRDWATQNGYQKGLSIHRKDNEKSYLSSNCEWLTKSEHSKKGAENRRRVAV